MMNELPPGRIEIPRGKRMYQLRLTPGIHTVLRIYARQNNTSITDAGNRIILGFLSEYYGYVSPAELRKRALKALFPTGEVLKEAFIAVLKGKRPRRRPVPLHKDDKLPSFLTESDSSEQDSP